MNGPTMPTAGPMKQRRATLQEFPPPTEVTPPAPDDEKTNGYSCRNDRGGKRKKERRIGRTERGRRKTKRRMDGVGVTVVVEVPYNNQ